MSLSERLRPEVEAAPWVIEEVKKLEIENSVLLSTLKQTKEMLKDTLAFIEAMEEQTK
jgi:hypothetical protein